MFEIADGWFLGRKPNGSVYLEHREPPTTTGTLLDRVECSAINWVDGVVYVGARKPSPGRRALIMDFHGVNGEESKGDLPPTWEGG